MERKVYLEPTKLPKMLTVKELYWVYAYWYPPTFNFIGESHEPMELVYVQTGSTLISTNSYSVILIQGELLIHKPWDFHKIQANNLLQGIYFFILALQKFSREKPDRQSLHDGRYGQGFHLRHFT